MTLFSIMWGWTMLFSYFKHVLRDILNNKRRNESRVNSLFIQENCDDDADDEDDSQDRAHHPYEAVSSLGGQRHVRLESQHRVAVRAGSKHSLTGRIREKSLRKQIKNAKDKNLNTEGTGLHKAILDRSILWYIHQLMDWDSKLNTFWLKEMDSK